MLDTEDTADELGELMWLFLLFAKDLDGNVDEYAAEVLLAFEAPDPPEVPPPEPDCEEDLVVGPPPMPEREELFVRVFAPAVAAAKAAAAVCRLDLRVLFREDVTTTP